MLKKMNPSNPPGAFRENKAVGGRFSEIDAVKSTRENFDGDGFVGKEKKGRSKEGGFANFAGGSEKPEVGLGSDKRSEIRITRKDKKTIEKEGWTY